MVGACSVVFPPWSAKIVRMPDAKLVAIFSKRAHGGPRDGRGTGTLETAKGLVGSADYGGTRQVTLLSQERWIQLMTEVGATLAPHARRANLVLTGIALEHTRGRTLRIGP